MRVFWELYEAYRSAYQYLEERLARAGVAPLEAQIIVLLETCQLVPLTEIKQRFRLSGSSLNSVLNRLESAGLVERYHPCGDRRVTCVGLTSAGRSQAPQLREVLVELDIRVCAQLPPEQVALLRRALNSIQFVVDRAGESRPTPEVVEFPLRIGTEAT